MRLKCTDAEQVESIKKKFRRLDIKRNKILDLEELSVGGYVIQGKMQPKYWVPAKSKLPTPVKNSGFVDKPYLTPLSAESKRALLRAESAFLPPIDNSQDINDVTIEVGSGSPRYVNRLGVHSVIKIQAYFRGYRQRQISMALFQAKFNDVATKYTHD